MLIDDRHRVFHNLLGGAVAIACVMLQLRQMVVQLVEQAFPQVAASNSRRIELAHNFQRFMQIRDREVYERAGADAVPPT